VSVKASAGTTTSDANGPPLDCWQSRQWRLSMNIGSAWNKVMNLDRFDLA
jgi:hypothetical protein